MNKNIIKCILFDLDNTLIETRKADARTCETIAQELKSRFNVHDASAISTKFLRNFRKCPENTRMSLQEWRSHLWKHALGDRYRHYTGAEQVIEIEPTDQIQTVKERLEEAEGTAADQQRLIYKGKFLKNEKTIESYRLKNGAMLQMVKALRSK